MGGDHDLDAPGPPERPEPPLARPKKRVRSAIRDAVAEPTAKQKEAYGRLAHTLSAASLIGAVTIPWTSTGWTLDMALRTFALVVSSVVLFVLGALFSEG